MDSRASSGLRNRVDRRGIGTSRLVGFRARDGKSENVTLATGNSARLEIDIDGYVPGLSCTVTVYSWSGAALFCVNHGIQRCDSQRDCNEITLLCDIPQLLLLPGKYRINAALAAGGEMLDHVEAACVFDVAEGVVDGSVVRPNGYGLYHQPHCWRE
jgi:lipopolysaccharide transport system ATP-binding protein